jgi:hypothetical protein
VSGEGRSSLGALIRQDGQALRMLRSQAHACPLDLDTIPAAGQTVRLATIGSTRVGGLYRDGAALITDALTATVDRIAREMPDFHFGRFDVRFNDVAELQAGRGFSIMEVNGAGSEAIQARDPGTGLIAGRRMIFSRQSLLNRAALRLRMLSLSGSRPAK